LAAGETVSIVTVGLWARVAVTPSTSTNGNGHLAFMGDSPPTIRASIEARIQRIQVLYSRHIIQARAFRSLTGNSWLLKTIIDY
jgi:hypothetical protein